jgi:hypothetical protein
VKLKNRRGGGEQESEDSRGDKSSETAAERLWEVPSDTEVLMLNSDVIGVYSFCILCIVKNYDSTWVVKRR